MELFIWICFGFSVLCFALAIIRGFTMKEEPEDIDPPEVERVIVIREEAVHEKKSNTYWIDKHLHADDERKEQHKRNQTPW